MSQLPSSQTANSVDWLNGLAEADADLTTLSTARQIVTRIGRHRLVFQGTWVAEVVLLKQEQVLHLPFYDPAVLGVVSYQGSIMPLIAAQQILSVVERPLALPETLTVIRLSDAIPDLAGVGIWVEQLVGQQAPAIQSVATAKQETADDWIWFNPDMIATKRWQPQR